MRKLVSSHSFDMFFALVVVSNSLFMGIEVVTWKVAAPSCSPGGATFRNHHLREGAEFAFAKDAGPLGKKGIVSKKDKQSTSAKGIKSLA